MNYLQRFIEEVRILLFITLLANNAVLLLVWYAAKEMWHLPYAVVVTALLFIALITNFLLERIVARIILQPMKLLWANILHLSPIAHGEHAIPKPAHVWLGRDLVNALTAHVHQLALVAYDIEQVNAHTLPDLRKDFIAGSLPLPLIILDKNENILFANMSAQHYFNVNEDDFFGHNLKLKLNMTFSQTDQDLSSWLEKVKQDSATATRSWDAVSVDRPDGQGPLRFDLAAFYNKDNPRGAETMLICFDHTDKYAQDNQETGFIALAIHELRTPITMLRGYIEALDEELDGKLTGETQDYFNKMKVSSQQLTTFIDNILDVARVEGNQLEVQLQEEDWADVIKASAENLQLRAEVRGLQLRCDIAENLPTAGIDRFSITQVITNIVENAIKYSAGKGQEIVIQARPTQDGLIETIVTDQGVGIPESVVPTLFNKFQRNFHNRATISGTGLGLYLSKVIVNLHGGNIWVSSKEGEGTSVGFTVRSYASLSDDQKSGRESKVIHGSRGWIKNHSMSRR